MGLGPISHFSISSIKVNPGGASPQQTRRDAEERAEDLISPRPLLRLAFCGGEFFQNLSAGLLCLLSNVFKLLAALLDLLAYLYYLVKSTPGFRSLLKVNFLGLVEDGVIDELHYQIVQHY